MTTNDREKKIIFEDGRIALSDNQWVKISDGYHTFDELYDHRISLFIALCRIIDSVDFAEWGKDNPIIWRSKRHSDGEICFGTGSQFVMGIGTETGKQITYHIPIERWSEADFARDMEIAPKWDGHSSEEVLERIKKLEV